jgi:archaellum component FlaC
LSLTVDQLTDRIEVIENLLNTMQTTMNNLTTKKEMKALQNIRQNEIIELQTQIASLQAQVELLQQ